MSIRGIVWGTDNVYGLCIGIINLCARWRSNSTPKVEEIDEALRYVKSIEKNLLKMRDKI